MLLLEVTDSAPITPMGGWNVGHLANLGILLSCDEFSARLDVHNLNIMFDIIEDESDGEIRDHERNVIEIRVTEDGVVLIPRNEPALKTNGILLDLETLKEMGIEQYEEQQQENPTDPSADAEPTSEFEPLEDEVTIGTDQKEATTEPESIDEGVKRAWRRSGKKIKRGFRVTSGFRKGQVVSNARAAYKPRKKASTRMKLKLAMRKKRIVRILRGKRTRRKPFSQRLVRMNKRLK